MVMRVAVILFNLGGPDSLEAVGPFLRNLFSDPRIIRVPRFFRWLVARLIARRRTPLAQAIYAKIGGASPILPNTRAQADALDRALAGDGVFKTFIAMRHWHPRAEETRREVVAWGAERVVLLPLYPQFSTTTTASSFDEWDLLAPSGVQTRRVCCYAECDGFVSAMAALTRESHERASAHGRPWVLFSAHGLPKHVVAAGDPYPWQVERTAAAIAARMAITDLAWSVSYQSRVGPLAWIGPATEDEVKRLGRARRPIVLAPIAFVSEHSETLVELDMECREEAMTAGAPVFERVATVGDHPLFIAGLAQLVRQALVGDSDACISGAGARVCPADRSGCPCAVTA
jgi:ferrochelatase